jgi:hypothetical protein
VNDADTFILTQSRIIPSHLISLHNIMGDVETIRLARLNDSNYAEWAVRMEAILIKKGLWSVVKIPEIDAAGETASTITAEKTKKIAERDSAKMQEARAELILRVDDGQLSHMRSEDPMEIWATLERVHRAAGFATSLALRRKFLTAKKGEGQSMQAWIGDIQALAFRMSQANICVTDQDRILALTMGLPSSYDAVIINFDSTPADQLTLNNVIVRLLNEESRQASQLEPNEKRVENTALAVTSPKPKPAVKTSNSADITCFFCDGKGHYKLECPEKVQWEKSKKKNFAGCVEECSDDEDFSF